MSTPRTPRVPLGFLGYMGPKTADVYPKNPLPFRVGVKGVLCGHRGFMLRNERRQWTCCNWVGASLAPRSAWLLATPREEMK